MAVLNKIIPLILPVILTGCYESFEPKLDTTPVLCLNSLITAGSPIEVKVSRTWLYTDSDGAKDHSVDDVVLRIYANGKLVESGYIPKEGDHIRVSASSVRYGEAEAEVTVPVPTRISGIELTNKVGSLWIQDIPGWGIDARLEFSTDISMSLDDPKDVDNFHLLEYDTFNQSYRFDDEDNNEYTPVKSGNRSKASFSSGYFESVDPVFYEQTSTFEEVLNYSAYNMFFSDRLLNQENNALDFGFTPCFFELSGWHMNPAELECGWDITLYSISESYYNWLAYCWQTDGIVFGEMGDWGLSEPIWGYSNVSTGAGVVAARSSVTVKVDLKDFLLKTIESQNP